MSSRPPTHPFEFWWILLGGALGAGLGVTFPGIGVPIGAGFGMIGGLGVALLRKSREWKPVEEARPHFHERTHEHRKGDPHKRH